MKKKVLLLGATGMAGHIIYLYLQATGNYDLVNVVYREKLTEDSIVVDVTDRELVTKLIREVCPEIIINCIGILIKGSREYPDNAIYINAYFPHLLERISSEVGAKLIHISTDCVFSGRKGNYEETDFRDADDIYGRSKALGEIINDKDLTLRTSIIGPELKVRGEGLFHWFMMNQTGQVDGFETAIWGGVTTLELAKVVDYSIRNNLSGLVHVSNGEAISKYELLVLFNGIWNKKTMINPVNANGIDKSIALSCKINYKVSSYERMLEEQYQWMEAHKSLYTQYY